MLLEEASVLFEVVPAMVQEVVPGPRAPFSPCEIVLLNALIKARNVAAHYCDRIVLGADTLVSLDGEALGKPKDMTEAFYILQKLAGRSHQVVSGVCILCKATGFRHSFIEVSRVTFRPLTHAQIHDYLHRINPLDKAGAYAAQEDRGEVIAKIQGSRSNVIGLPMESLLAVLNPLRFKRWP